MITLDILPVLVMLFFGGTVAGMVYVVMLLVKWILHKEIS